MANQNQSKGTESAKGQQKMHQIRNSQTGESREVSQEQWRTDGKTLREQGFERVDAEDGTETPEGGDLPPQA